MDLDFEINARQQGLCSFVQVINGVFGELFKDTWITIEKGFTIHLEEEKNQDEVLVGYSGFIYPANWEKDCHIFFRSNCDMDCYFDVFIHFPKIDQWLSQIKFKAFCFGNQAVFHFPSLLYYSGCSLENLKCLCGTSWRFGVSKSS